MEYIEREAAIQAASIWNGDESTESWIKSALKKLPAADVVEREEGIRIGAELAAMHGSDATSEDLERAFWTGFEEAMKKRDVRPVILCRDCKHSAPWYRDKSRCFLWHKNGIDVFNDGFCNYGEKREEN